MLKTRLEISEDVALLSCSEIKLMLTKSLLNKLHQSDGLSQAIEQRHRQRSALPNAIGLRQASVYDLKAMRPILEQCQGQHRYFDKAHTDKALEERLLRAGNRFFTPVKVKAYTPLVLRQRDAAADALFSTAVARQRQPIEPLFNWLHQKRGLQTASFVRSQAGLLPHVLGKIAAALII